MAQGVWAARDKEFLSSSDISIVRARRFLVNAAKAAEREDAAATARLELSRVRAFSDLIPAGADWRKLPTYGPEAYAGYVAAAE
jgi:LigXa C-terminal domain like